MCRNFFVKNIITFSLFMFHVLYSVLICPLSCTFPLRSSTLKLTGNGVDFISIQSHNKLVNYFSLLKLTGLLDDTKLVENRVTWAVYLAEIYCNISSLTKKTPVQHWIQWTRRRHTVLQVSYTGSQPLLCASFWLFHHVADQLFKWTILNK